MKRKTRIQQIYTISYEDTYCRIFLEKATASYGNCFVFNTIENQYDDEAGQRTSALTGPTYGLSLVLNLDQRNYMKGGQSKQAGARLTISAADTISLQDEMGMDLSPHTLTQVAIQATNVTRQPAPYTSHCYADWNSTDYGTLMQGTPFIPPYSIAVSQKHCDGIEPYNQKQ